MRLWKWLAASSVCQLGGGYSIDMQRSRDIISLGAKLVVQLRVAIHPKVIWRCKAAKIDLLWVAKPLRICLMFYVVVFFCFVFFCQKQLKIVG